MVLNPNPQALYELFETTTEAKPMWYSGRGMMGTECLAISGSWKVVQDSLIRVLTEMHEAVVEEVHEESDVDVLKVSQPFHDLIDNLLHFSWDNLGHDVVLYFKDIPRAK